MEHFDTLELVHARARPPPAMHAVRQMVQRVARGTISVLLLGETGVGKERMAEAVHHASPRAALPFVCLNCAALSESLIESELFGYEKGAFTNAVATKPGLLETADGGTVFLDEVGELPLALQVKLLRVLEDRRLMRVGAVKPRTIDVRFVAATNRDLQAGIAAGRFREDLFFRLSGATIRIPPLRERVAEIRALAREFVGGVVAISEAAFARLEAHRWPGNIRELRNVMERAVLVCDGTTIEPEHLDLQPALVRGADPGIPARDLRGSLRETERQAIVDALERCGRNQTRAAALLGISRRTLIDKLDAHAIQRPRKGR